MSTPAESIARFEAAERETRAQLEIILLLKALPHDRRRSVVRAVAALLDAEREVGGVLDMFLRGSEMKAEAAGDRPAEGTGR